MDFQNTVVVISKKACFDVKCIAKDFADYLGSQVVTDDLPAQEKEVLLGQVDRPESAGQMDPGVCNIHAVGKKWVFDAVHYQPLKEAVAYIKERNIKDCPVGFYKTLRTQVPLTWGEYKLVWNDEFDGEKLDIEKWTGRANMCFSDTVLTMEEPTVAVKDGALVMTTTILDRSDPKARYLTNYAICTADTMNYRYGYMEIRAKVPMYAMGEWPSFWYKSQNSYLYWDTFEKENGYRRQCPYFMEVDGFEVFSSKEYVVSNLHKWFYQPGILPNGKESKWESLDNVVPFRERAYRFEESENPCDWHTYGFLWTPKKMSFFLDGQCYYTYDLSVDFCRFGGGMEDYDQALNVMFNNMLFSEGRNPKDSPKDELFPLVYEIDYCRLYQLENEGRIYLPEEPGHAVTIDPKGVDRRDHGTYQSQQA